MKPVKVNPKYKDITKHSPPMGTRTVLKVELIIQNTTESWTYKRPFIRSTTSDMDLPHLTALQIVFHKSVPTGLVAGEENSAMLIKNENYLYFNYFNRDNIELMN